MFTIKRQYKTHPPRYKLKDHKDEDIKGSFYEQDSTVNKEKHAVVRWTGYSKDGDSWIPASDMVKNL